MRKIRRKIDFRNDIYKDVAEEANSILEKKEHPASYTREKEFKKGEKTKETKFTHKVSDFYVGKVSRKLVKRNVMTTPYSVSKRGMFFQIKEILEETKAKGKSLFFEGEEALSLKLLTDVNEKAIKRTIKGAKVGQDFLVDITRRLMEKRKKNKEPEDKPIIWKSAMGFPIIQWYHKEKSLQINTPLVQVRIKQKSDKIDKPKQKSGIAPNLVHSLDATLLQFTVEKLVDKGVKDFMLIHDSFSTHGNHIDDLNIAFRESYVEIFEDNPLEKFIESVYPEALEEAKEIMINDLDLKDVLNSTYIIC